MPTLLQPLLQQVVGEPLMIVVNRRSILRSVELAMRRPDFTFFRPPKIHFSGEDAVDDGGPRREFFRFVLCRCRLLVTVSL